MDWTSVENRSDRHADYGSAVRVVEYRRGQTYLARRPLDPPDKSIEGLEWRLRVLATRRGLLRY